MDSRKCLPWRALLGLAFLIAVNFPVSAQTQPGSDSIIAVRLVDRSPLCFLGKVALACQDWEPSHSYNVGDQILPKTGNGNGFTFRASTAGESGTAVPTWPQAENGGVQDGPDNTGVHWVAQETISRHYIRVDFSDPHSDDQKQQDSDVGTQNVAATTTPSNKTLTLKQKGKFQPAFGNQVVVFELPDDLVTPVGDTGVKVCFTSYTFKHGSKTKTSSEVCGEGKTYNDDNIGDLVNDSKKALNDAVSTAKTSAEKNIFAGLNISVPSGGGDAQGSGDLYLNQYFSFPLVGQGILGVELQKGSSANADSRHFVVGIKARKTWLLSNKTDRNTVIAAIRSGSSDANAAAVSAMANIQKKYFRSIYFDNGLSYEGDISGGSLGNISNVLYDGESWVNTAVRSLTRQSGFFNFRILPVGIEAGYNVSASASTPLSGSSTTTVSSSAPSANYSLARLKSGMTFTLSSQSPYSMDNSARLDLEMSAVNRYLFVKELFYDSKTNTYSSTGTGNKYWAQIAFKLLAGPVGSGKVSGRPGLRLAFQRGSLPPVYAFTKVFTISLIFETNDNSSEEIKLLDQK
jgi:hypothetical protein